MGASASLEPRTLAVEPGGEATVALTVRNNGSVVDQFTIEVLGDAGAWATAEPPSLSLFPGAQETTRITFRPPRAPSTAAGPMRFGAMVRSKEDPDGSTVEEGMLDVGGFLAPAAELVPRTSHGSRTGRHEIALDNRGNLPLQVALQGVDPDRLVRFDFDPPALSVEPGAAGFAKLLVKPVRTFWRGPAKTRPFQVAVQPDAPGSTPLVVDGSYLQESILPWWFLRALLALAALLIGAILFWVLFLQPQIKATAADTLEEFGFTPRPTASRGGEESGPPPTPAPSDALNVTPPPEGGQTQVDGRLDTVTNAVGPTAGTLSITDLVFSNPTGASGELTLERRTPSGTTPLLVLRLENFRDLDLHFVTPITVRTGETIALVAACTPPAGPAPPAACTPAVFYSGYVHGE
ncbi:MAG: hypothetical protein FIA92_09420 [Chloroflexi bacterium]|nr:hypothetical protein [Chloroflexota bacterium]